ncbi:PqqD family peptide modification chaperone [Methylomonas sp. SURF-2]|uniref:PqqD family peptide modification chaperone n=1 Tax=Methylomonas subterranea TaxID=2952225 RepID=A0ABT1TJ15_9GAMM|nr:PqqD family protein [Methylomonas sp. SURF-2]MCQ8105047.1 PqqD family peptide modification chaperone [Methylomonas sp. SURF-2]
MDDKQILTLETRVARSERLTGSQVDNEWVMIDLESGEYYGLNAIASDIWQLLVEPIRVADLCADLLRRYDVDKERCEGEVLVLLRQMQEKRMLRVV